MIAGFVRFLAVKPNAKLLLIGDGPQRGELELLVDSLSLKDNVVFAGHVPEAGYLVKAMDVMVLPSSPAEAFGLVLLEAMAAGVPVISSDAPGPAEVHGNPNWQFAVNDSNDLANRLAKWQELPAQEREQLVKDGQQRVARDYSMTSFREKLELIF